MAGGVIELKPALDDLLVPQGFISVTKHGAKGDGVTDDTAAFVAANAEATAAGKSVFVPSGNYLCGTITLTASMTGAMPCLLKLKAATNNHLIEIGASSISVSGFVLDGNKAGQTSGSNCLNANGRDDLTLRDIVAVNAYTYGVRLSDCRRSRLNNVQANESGSTGIQLFAYAVDVDGVEIINCGSSRLADVAYYGGGIKLTTNSVTGKKFIRPTIQGTTVALPPNATSADSTCIEVWGGSAQPLIIGCRTTGGKFGITMDHANGAVVNDNTCYGHSAAATELAASPNGMISGNTIDVGGASGDSVSVSGASANSVVRNNTIINTGSNTIARAIYIGDTSHWSVVAGNQILAHVAQGIVVNGPTNVQVVGRNYVAWADDYGLVAYLPTGLRVTNGLVIGNNGGAASGPTNAVVITGNGSTDDIRIEGNDLRKATYAFNPSGTFGSNIYYLNNEGTLDWQQPLYFAPTGIAARRQAQIDAVANTNRNLIFGGSNNGSSYIDTSAGPLLLKAGGANGLQIGIDGSATLYGALKFNTDNAYDIGASGANRARDLFLGRNAVIGGTLDASGNVTIRGAAYIGGVSGAESLRVNTISSAVNRIEINGGTLNNNVSLIANGGDTNVGLDFASKGFYAVRIGTRGGSSFQVVINDVNGANRQVTFFGANNGRPILGTTAGSLLVAPYNIVSAVFLAVTNAVNYLSCLPAVSGGSPVLGIEGADTNVALTLANKGTAVTAFTGQTKGAATTPGSFSATNRWVLNIDGTQIYIPYSTTPW